MSLFVAVIRVLESAGTLGIAGIGMAKVHEPLPEDRLDSWKEIAAYLKREVRTVQRWEKEEGLPVHRHAHKKLGTVYAYRPEIDGWSAERRITLEGSPPKRETARRLPMSWVLAGAGLLLVGAAVLVWRIPNRPENRPLVFTKITTDTGLTQQPALSPNGELIAYASDRLGDGNLDIWVQQTSHGTPIRRTNHAADDYDPAFSPDGTKIVFRSDRDGGGIYEAPALAGEARKIADEGRRPRYSPDGKWIAYWTGIRPDRFGKLFIIPAGGGQPRRLLDDSVLVRSPVWAPDGRHLLFFGYSPLHLMPGIWSVAPLDGGPITPTGTRELFERAGLSGAVAIVPDPDVWIPERNEVIFSAKSGDSTNLWKVSISPQTWKIVGQPQRLTSGTGLELHSSISSGGLLVFSSLTRSLDIWSLPIDTDRAKVTGEIQPLTRDAADDLSPSISHDGRRLAFESFRTGKRLVWTKDLGTGREAALTDTPSYEALPQIAPDGSKVAYSIFTLKADPGDIYVAPFMGGQPKKVCEKCGYGWGWSPDSTKLIYGDERSDSVLDFAASRQYKVIEVPGLQIYQGLFSWDGQWILFGTGNGREPSRRFVARFRNGEQVRQSDWIPMADGSNNLWSPNGTLVYFASPLDGSLCLWSSRLNPETKRPMGPPQPVYHFHRARFSLIENPAWRGISVARDKIVFTLKEVTGNIWMATPQP